MAWWNEQDIEHERVRVRNSVECNFDYLGHFDTMEQAAHAYDLAAKFFFGDFAYLNRVGDV